VQCGNDTLIPGFAHEESDIALMLRVRGNDDAEAFALLSSRYRTPLKRLFAALLPDASHADDFAQETLLRLWQSRSRYEPTGKFSAYLFQIGRNYYLNQRLRYRERLVQEISSESTSGVEILSASPHTQPEIILLERLGTARLQRHIAELPSIYREVFTLSHSDGLKYAEIAERLGIPMGTVKSRMAEAVRRLRAEIPREEC
jgi:RNA polymerase sigma-70 factor (ECF subfamily)